MWRLLMYDEYEEDIVFLTQHDLLLLVDAVKDKAVGNDEYDVILNKLFDIIEIQAIFSEVY